MATPQEICTVTAGGRKYDNWETVEVHKSASDVIDHCMLTVSEPSTGGSGLAALKLAPGTPASVTLGGAKAINGLVYLRQAAADDKTHAVQIGIASKSQIILRTSVDGKPGQYLNQTIQQIGSAVFGKVGVGFNVIGGPSGANTPFARVSETIGQTRFSFIENLCRMRNLHLIDDGQGGISAFRGSQGSSVAPLQEGVNILKSRLLLKADEYTEDLTGLAQIYKQGAPGAQVSATATVNNPVGSGTGGNYSFPIENAGDQATVQMRVNHQADHINYETVDGVITVQGWFLSPGDLWMNHVPADVTVNSPMLIPGGSASFIIKEVIHRQSSAEGTTTDILITNENGLGSESLQGAQ
jgi:prophage tail gpP-like protein